LVHDQWAHRFLSCWILAGLISSCTSCLILLYINLHFIWTIL
jgi:hypothetical protein